jgi:two-component system cell cycle response regulator
VCWPATSVARSRSPRSELTSLDPLNELERNRVVVQLAGAVAHKLKQPLAVAWGYLELLLDDPNLDLAPSTQSYLREIQESLHTMDDVINMLQQVTVYQTRPYAGSVEILDFDIPA